MTPTERLERFADLAVRVGANVQPGQEVVLIYQVEHTPIARAIARAALRAGARRVLPTIGDLHLRKAAIELGPRGGARHVARVPPRLDADLARDAAGDHPAHRRPRARACSTVSTRSSSRRPIRTTPARSTCRSSWSGWSTG